MLTANKGGIGKTIEVGLIFKELQVWCELKSVLIICSKPLVNERKNISTSTYSYCSNYACRLLYTEFE